MWWLIGLAVVLYAGVGFAWGMFLHALTNDTGSGFSWRSFLHGLFWPASIIWVAL